MPRPTFLRLALLCALASPLVGCQAPERGTWFWQSTSSPYGTASIVGDPDAEAAAVTRLEAHDIKRVYGSYGARPEAGQEPSVIAAWNTRLHQAGVRSDLLLSDNTWIFPANRPILLGLVDARLLAFNAGRPAAERFDGLHLDLEPQALDAWDTGDAAAKRDLLWMLADTLTEVRAHLDAAGKGAVPLAADLAVWFDSSPSIGWVDTADRDAFFAAVSAACLQVSLMAYERPTADVIFEDTSWEMQNMATEVVVGLDVDIPGTWPDLDTLFVVASQVELLYPSMPGADVHAFTDIIAAEGGLP